MDNIKKDIDNSNSNLSDDLLKKIILKDYNLPHSEITIYKNKYGKKYVQHNELKIFFNTSYCDEWGVICISDKEVGVDIEKIRKINHTHLATYFTNEEEEYLNKLELNRAILEFFRIWTSKESFIKYKGMGLSYPLNQFRIPLHPSDNQYVYDYNNPSEKVSIASYILNKNYYLSICY